MYDRSSLDVEIEKKSQDLQGDSLRHENEQICTHRQPRISERQKQLLGK